jgi:hypothetical protein
MMTKRWMCSRSFLRVSSVCLPSIFRMTMLRVAPQPILLATLRGRVNWESDHLTSTYRD